MTYSKLIYNKEFGYYFNSPTAYIILVVFLLIAGYTFANGLFLMNQANLQLLFYIVPVIFLFFVPAVTMSSITRERSGGTLELLTTLPMTDSSIVLGKFWASVALIAIALLFTLLQLITIVVFGKNVDFGPILGGYLGLILLGATISSFGIFAATLTDNQVIAFIISFFITAFFFLLQIVINANIIPVGLVDFLQYFSIFHHYDNMARGVIDTRNVIMMLTLTLLFLRVAVIVMESRKWR